MKLPRMDRQEPTAAYCSSAPKAPAITVTWLTTGRALSATKTRRGRPVMPNRVQQLRQITGDTTSRSTSMVGRPRRNRRFFSPTSYTINPQ